MKKIIIFLICFASIFTMISCNQKIGIKDSNVVDDLKSKIELLDKEYLNKYDNKTIKSDEVKKLLYVKVASNLKTSYSTAFGTVNFDNKDKVKFGIGNNSYIYALAFYKMKDELFVFAPLLALEGGLNKTLLFCVDGQYFSVKVYDGKNEDLTLKSAESEDKKAENIRLEKNEADRDVITYTTDKIENKLYVNLQKNEEDLSPNSIFFIRKSYQKYSNPTEYIMFENNQNNLSVELNQKDLSNSISKNEKYNIDVQITLFGGGSIGFDLDLKRL